MADGLKRHVCVVGRHMRCVERWLLDSAPQHGFFGLRTLVGARISESRGHGSRKSPSSLACQCRVQTRMTACKRTKGWRRKVSTCQKASASEKCKHLLGRGQAGHLGERLGELGCGTVVDAVGGQAESTKEASETYTSKYGTCLYWETVTGGCQLP
jgi:hypothetical protein